MWEIILVIVCLLILYYLRNGAIFVPTDSAAVVQMVKLAQVHSGMKVADLGSGDGRIVIAFAQAGASVDGFEINPLLSWGSQLKIRGLKLPNARIITKSFWGQDLSQYDIIVVFGMTHIMDRLQKKLRAELRPGAIVISHIFKFSDWIPVVEQGSLRVYRR